MGKKGGHSWLTAVKRAFRSPTKKKNSRTREESEVPEEEEEKVINFLNCCEIS